jgi:FMN phosphatase YigB (HAD superfamily)
MLMPADSRIVVLDVHGVIFTNPLTRFLAELAQRHGRESAEVLQTWTSQLRRPFWLGQLDEQRMWQTLFPASEPDALTAELEQRYAKGPLFDALPDIDEPVWLLSNHRTHWLLPRLARFGLADRFERVYVSDAIGFVKPEAEAFRLVQREAGEHAVTYVDDKWANVTVAAEIFAEALIVGEADRLTTTRIAAR